MERLEIAGTCIDLELPPGSAQGHFTSRFRRFARSQGAGSYFFRVGPEPLSEPPAFTGRVVRTATGRFAAEGGETFGELDLATRSGELRADPCLRGFDVLLRTAISHDILERGGCLLHAAGVVVDGFAYLLLGPSGAGKSTAASLSEFPLSDDLCAVLPDSGGFIAYATPWWAGRVLSAPLGGIYTLSWNGEQIVSESRSSGMRHLMGSLALCPDEPEPRAVAFAAAGRIARAVSFGRLTFTPQSKVDALLRAARAAA